MTRPLRRSLLLLAQRTAVPELAALREAWAEAGIDVEVACFDRSMPDLPSLVEAFDAEGTGPDAALLIGPARRAPSTVLPGTVGSTRKGRRVPLAWLPATDARSLQRFALAAARVHRRQGTSQAVALLGQWQPQYLHVADRMRTLASEQGLRAFRWTGDALTREALVQALGSGLGLGVYVGHGRPVGWVGYHGVRAHHFDAGESQSRREPMGAMLSLCCRTASRRRVAQSYAESLPLLGVAAASFGAIGDTLHTDNTRWAVGICQALAEGARTVGDLLVRAAPASPGAQAAYRLIGDPMAPLASDPHALARAERVRTFE